MTSRSDAIEAAILAAERRSVKVKPLEWRDLRGDGTLQAFTHVGLTYYASDLAWGYRNYPDLCPLEGGLDAAKAAAQADYEARIRSALIPGDHQAELAAAERRGIERAAEVAHENRDRWIGDDEHWGDAAQVIAAAILALLPEGDGWLPIESAPRDGTKMIVSDGLGVYGGAWFHKSEKAWLDCDGCEPTMFQPLPNPPTAKE